MENFQAITAGYRWGRSKTNNLINVYNENSYVMAEYNENSGVLVWHRVMTASQKSIIEDWLYSHFQAKQDEVPAKKQRVA